jgi:TRAP-type C4-dicarboxylate transport system permease large subunit
MSWYRSRHNDISGGERAPISLIFRTFVVAIPGLTLPFVIRAAVIDGIATATEVSTSAWCRRLCSDCWSTDSLTGGASIRCWSIPCRSPAP